MTTKDIYDKMCKDTNSFIRLYNDIKLIVGRETNIFVLDSFPAIYYSDTMFHSLVYNMKQVAESEYYKEDISLLNDNRKYLERIMESIANIIDDLIDELPNDLDLSDMSTKMWDIVTDMGNSYEEYKTEENITNGDICKRIAKLTDKFRTHYNKIYDKVLIASDSNIIGVYPDIVYVNNMILVMSDIGNFLETLIPIAENIPKLFEIQGTVKYLMGEIYDCVNKELIQIFFDLKFNKELSKMENIINEMDSIYLIVKKKEGR